MRWAAAAAACSVEVGLLTRGIPRVLLRVSLLRQYPRWRDPNPTSDPTPEPTPNQVEGACLALSLPLTRWRVLCLALGQPLTRWRVLCLALSLPLTRWRVPCLALSLPLTRWRVLCRACPRVPPSHSAAPSPCCRPRYREVWADMGRYGQMWADVGRCGEIWGDVRRCGERCAQPLLPAEI